MPAATRTVRLRGHLLLPRKRWGGGRRGGVDGALPPDEKLRISIGSDPSAGLRRTAVPEDWAENAMTSFDKNIRDKQQT